MKKKKIIIVDDSPIAASWVVSALTGHGHEVVTHASPFGIQQRLREEHPDLMLLDIHMPALNGVSACKLIKSRGTNPDLVILLYSSLSMEELEAKALEATADGFIQKTGSVEEFMQQLKTYL